MILDDVEAMEVAEPRRDSFIIVSSSSRTCACKGSGFGVAGERSDKSLIEVVVLSLRSGCATALGDFGIIRRSAMPRSETTIRSGADPALGSTFESSGALEAAASDLLQT